MIKYDPSTGLRVLYKQPAESRIYHMDLSNLLGSSSIKSVIAVNATRRGNVLGSQDLVIGAPRHDETRVAFSLGGGTTGEDYKVTVRVESTSGEVVEGEGYLYVREL
ncbi:hypothetical protein D6833_09325 [Candidatus Parcubacteria bacterium]|nr:MAG: hypothetical protein D6833_09325 [Candidatus Parcubacteria bacterium]